MGGACPGCSNSIASVIECKEPRGYRTNFKPEEVQPDYTGASFRTVHAQPAAPNFEASHGSNLRIQAMAQAKTYRVNQGTAKKLFTTTECSTDGPSRQKMRNQALAIYEGKKAPWGVEQTAAANDAHYALVASKVTDAIALSTSSVCPGLRLHLDEREEVETKGKLETYQQTAIRAASITATFILADRAAMALDIDPEEFDVLAPRVWRQLDGVRHPVIQFADKLANGAGFCTRLASRDSTGIAEVEQIILSVLDDPNEYPRKLFERPGHQSACERACYRCLMRYRNQPYHAILDWRLGLAFLRSLVTEGFQCGLDGNIATFELQSWRELLARDIEKFCHQFNAQLVSGHDFVPVIRLPRSGRSWIVGHPLWDFSNPTGLLEASIAEYDNPGFIDSFSFSRRPWDVREEMKA